MYDKLDLEGTINFYIVEVENSNLFMLLLSINSIYFIIIIYGGMSCHKLYKFGKIWVCKEQNKNRALKGNEDIHMVGKTSLDGNLTTNLV